jgi:hypothetical protein
MDAATFTRRGAWLIALVSALLVYQFTTGDAITNPASRLATMDALVHDHTFTIDHSPLAWTIDKVQVGGHFYSSKPPLLSTVGAAVYWGVYHLTGLSIRGGDAARYQAIFLVTLVLMLGCHLVLLAYGYRLLRRWHDRPEVVLPAFAALALAYLGFGYATSINNHGPAAVACLAGFYHAFAARRGEAPRWRHFALAGFFGGLAPALDLGAVFVSIAIGLYLLAADWRATLRWLAPAAVPPVALHFALTWAIAGRLLPVYLDRQAYLYPGSYWRSPTDLDALAEPRLLYVSNMLFGHHGLFTMTPLLVLALVALGVSLARRDEHAREAAVVGGAFVVLVVFYTLTTRNYGGTCVGFRWLMIVTPLLMLFLADWLRTPRGRLGLVAFGLLFAVSQFNAVDALRGPWRTSAWHALLASLHLA